MELWDAYTKDFERLDFLFLVRGRKIPDGIFHLASDVLVARTDGSVLMLLRNSDRTSGGMWEVSAGGAAKVGEDARECAERELFEETGIRGTDFTELGRYVDQKKHTLYVQYLFVTDGKADVVLDHNEHAYYIWINPASILCMNPSEVVLERVRPHLEKLVAKTKSKR